MSKVETDEPTLTRAEAAELAGKHERTIDRWADLGRITRYKVGGLQWVRFKESEVRAMMETEAKPGPAHRFPGDVMSGPHDTPQL